MVDLVESWLHVASMDFSRMGTGLVRFARSGGVATSRRPGPQACTVDSLPTLEDRIERVQSDSDRPTLTFGNRRMKIEELVPHVESLQQDRSEMLDGVTRFCNQNSGTFNLDGLAAMHQLVWDAFSILGGEMQSLAVDPYSSVDEKGHLVARPLGRAIHIVKRAEVRPRVLLCIHMDTVYGPDHPFQRCEFEDEERTRLRGPGVIDAKGGLVVMLHALKALEASPLANRIGWEVVVNPDEEIGSPGSEELLKQCAARADVGLLFEPAYVDGAMVSARKGTGNFEFVVRGRAAHSGRDFDKGRNAVVACCQLMAEMFGWNGKYDATINPARIRGGNALNIVPDLAIGGVNIRVASTAVQQELERDLDAVTERYNRLDGLLEGIQVERHGRFSSPPKERTAGVAALQRRIEVCGQALGQEITWRESGGASDGNKFAAAGLDNIDTLGPIGNFIHSDREYLCVDSLVPKAQLAALVLLSIAAGLDA